MAQVTGFPDGGYRFVEGVFQYSAAVAALPGFELERVRLLRPVALPEAFPMIAAHLASIGRPTAALCACELRSPAPFTEQGFAGFNQAYVGQLAAWDIVRGGVNPVARSNVCPQIEPPGAPAIHAFTYTVPSVRDARRSFVVAGSAECPEGRSNYGDHVVRPGDVSPEGLREKARWVLGEMERRMDALGSSWRDATAVQVYTVHDLHPFLGDEIVRRGAADGGLTWHFARPPVRGLEYEMDCRAVARELVLDCS